MSTHAEESAQTPVPNPEDVPAELRERDQWLMWDTAEDKPRAPLNERGVKASWTDPDEWLSFDEAREIAEGIDTRGIGYVFAYADTDKLQYARGLYGGLDLDRCVESPHGSPKEWLPSLAPFIDRGAYIEWSPSATGLHIPLAGFEPPEWWSDRDAAFGDHEGVEAYGSKFFTFTGDRLEPNEDDEIDAGREVADAGEWVVDWLAEVYKAKNGYDPRDADDDLNPIHGDRDVGGDGDGDEWVDEEVAEDALDHINPDVGHAEWFSVGVSLVNHLGESAGGRLFDQWSRGGSKYDADHVESVIDDADEYGLDIRYLVNAAKSHGWDASEAARQAVTTAPDGGTAITDTTAPAATAEDGDADPDDLTEAILDKPTAWFDAETETVTIHPVDGFALDTLAERFENHDVPDGVISDVALAIDDDARDVLKAWRNADDGDEWDVEIADVDTETWDDIIPEFYADTKSTRGRRKDQARLSSVNRLLDEQEILQTKEGGTVFVYDEDRGYYRRDGAEAELETHLERRLSYAFSPARSTRIIKTACARCRAFADELGGPDRELCLANGVLDISELDDHDADDPGPTLSPHTPEKWFTAGLPVEYNADADCPRFEQFIEESVEPDDRAKLQEFAGYCLLVNEQPFKKALFLVGPTDSGKGTFLKVIEKMFGFENVATQSLHSLTDTRWGPHSLFGRAINIRNEISRRDVKNPQKFKELTGGEDPIDAEDKGESKYKFIVTQKLLFATNQFPEVEGADDAFYNRLLFASFPNRVPDSRKDHDLDEKLEDELPGILNWAIEGLARLLDNKQFTDVRDQQAKESLVEQFGGLEERFAHACLDITGDDGDMVVKGDLHDLALTYAQHSGVDERPTQRAFTTAMKKMEGVGDDKQRVDGDSEKVYTGVRVESKALAALDTDVRSRTSDGTGSDPQSRLDDDPAPEPEPDAGDSSQEDTAEADDGLEAENEDADGKGNDELAVSSARKPIAEAIEESEGGATTEEVVEAVPHTPEKAREHIEAMLEADDITRDDDGRLKIA